MGWDGVWVFGGIEHLTVLIIGLIVSFAAVFIVKRELIFRHLLVECKMLFAVLL